MNMKFKKNPNIVNFTPRNNVSFEVQNQSISGEKTVFPSSIPGRFFKRADRVELCEDPSYLIKYRF